MVKETEPDYCLALLHSWDVEMQNIKKLKKGSHRRKATCLYVRLDVLLVDVGLTCCLWLYVRLDVLLVAALAA